MMKCECCGREIPEFKNLGAVGPFKRENYSPEFLEIHDHLIGEIKEFKRLMLEADNE